MPASGEKNCVDVAPSSAGVAAAAIATVAMRDSRCSRQLSRHVAPREKRPSAVEASPRGSLSRRRMLPSSTRPADQRMHVMRGRLRLAALRWARESPKATVLLLMTAFTLLLSLMRRCPPCAATQCHCAAASDVGSVAMPTMTIPQVDMGHPLPLLEEGKSAATTMAHVVVGVMTARRFHRTRCQVQSDTWLRRARRVVFFSDSADGTPSDDLQAPIVSHRFVPSPTERVFAGGNWRAVPILRTLAHGFFSARAQVAMRARSEPLPRWTFMVDDDSYVFVNQMLSAIADLDADEPHYLGYAFIAAPHLEGIIVGKRQPLFANGGAGIAVSRGALVAALPLFARCEATYKWNWPGDVRVAQCLLDAGVGLTWKHAFHAEAPGVIIHKQRPPPGSVPVGLHLPPISFHHVDADQLHALERMHAVPLAVGGRTLEADFSNHAFQPLSATHPTSGVQLQLHYGFEVLLCPPGANGCSSSGPTMGSVFNAALRTRRAEDGAASGLSAVVQPGKVLAAFEAGRAMGADGLPSSYLHTFTGGECSQQGQLMGGLSALVTTHCGEKCDGNGAWHALTTESGLTVCNFTFAKCTLHVSVALPRCPRPLPVQRLGLDAGTMPGWADVARDGVASRRWAGGCDGDACASLRISRAGNLTLWFRVLSSSAELRVGTPSVSRAGLRVIASEQVVLLSGAVTDEARASAQPSDAGPADEEYDAVASALEPPATSLTFSHACELGAVGDFDVRVAIGVRRRTPMALGWRARCAG